MVVGVFCVGGGGGVVGGDKRTMGESWCVWWCCRAEPYTLNTSHQYFYHHQIYTCPGSVNVVLFTIIYHIPMVEMHVLCIRRLYVSTKFSTVT